MLNDKEAADGEQLVSEQKGGKKKHERMWQKKRK